MAKPIACKGCGAYFYSDELTGGFCEGCYRIVCAARLTTSRDDIRRDAWVRFASVAMSDNSRTLELCAREADAMLAEFDKRWGT